jgi:hypothetical protein
MHFLHGVCLPHGVCNPFRSRPSRSLTVRVCTSEQTSSPLGRYHGCPSERASRRRLFLQRRHPIEEVL